MKLCQKNIGLLTRRTYGIETEYAIECDTLDEDRATNVLLGVTTEVTSRFIRNAGRIYRDIGHPEYATPECTDPWEVARYHHAGDVIMRDLQTLAAKRGIEIRLNRDNIDWNDDGSSKQHSYGCHENYLILRSVTDEQLKNNLTPFLVSSPLLFGSGYSDPSGDYHFSVRGTILDCEEAETTTSSNRATFLKVASTSIVLAMIEAGHDFSDLCPLEPVAAMKALNFDIWGNQRVITPSGLFSALSLQQEILSRVGRFLEGIAPWNFLPRWIFEAYEMWSQALQDLAIFAPNDCPPSSCWIDWWVKWQLLRAYQKEYPDAVPVSFLTCLGAIMRLSMM